MTVHDLTAFGTARERWSESVMYPVAFVVDISRLTASDATSRHRAQFAEHLKRFEPFEKRYTCAVGIVAGSAVTRTIVTAVFWLQQPTFAYSVVPTVEEAIVFTRARLELATRRGLELSAR